MNRKPTGWLPAIVFALALAAVLSLAACGGGGGGEELSPTPADETGPRLWLPMHEGSGGVVHDESGYGNHGTLQGGAAWATQDGVVCVKFIDGDDYISIPAAASINNLWPTTFGAWVWVPVGQMAGGNSHARIFSKQETAGRHQYLLYDPTCIRAHRFYGGQNSFGMSSTGAVVEGEWHYYVWQLLPDHHFAFYRDGVSQGLTGESLRPGTPYDDSAYAGRINGLVDNTQYLETGYIADVKYWPRALTPEEILAEYESTRGLYP